MRVRAVARRTRSIVLDEVAQRLEQLAALRDEAHRRAFAARDDQRVALGEFRRRAHFHESPRDIGGDVGAGGVERCYGKSEQLNVLTKGALEGENADCDGKGLGHCIVQIGVAENGKGGGYGNLDWTLITIP